MTTFRKTTLALAAAASLGTLSLASAPAFAGHGGGFGGHGGGMHIGHGGGWGHRWGYRGYGFGYGVYTAYVPECYYVRRFGALIKVCE